VKIPIGTRIHVPWIVILRGGHGTIRTCSYGCGIQAWYDEEYPDENKIRIYHDVYSDPEIASFDNNKPVIVQSAACGPPGEIDKRKTQMTNLTGISFLTGGKSRSMKIIYNEFQARKYG